MGLSTARRAVSTGASYPHVNHHQHHNPASVFGSTITITLRDLHFLWFLATADEWIPATKGLTERTSTVIKGLTTGDKLQFRVRAYNMAGPSAPATLAQPVTIREIMRE